MSLYKYRVLTTGSSVIEGKKDALTQTDLISDLRRSGYVVLKVQKVGKERIISLPFGRAKKGDILHFTQELATLLESGIPMDRSLAMMVDAQGKLVYVKDFPPSQSHILETINMSALAKGTYIVTVFFGEKEKRTLKVIKTD